MESFISVFAVGGDYVADFERVRQDEGLKKLGLRAPSPMSARWFLNAFHQVEPPQGRLPHEVFIPEEKELLKGLKVVAGDLIGKALREK